MGASNSSGNAQIYKLKVQKETGIPYFFRQEKLEEKWIDTDTFQNMEGYFKSVSMETYTHEGKTKQSLKVIMTDNMTDEKIIITMYVDNMTRSMLNTLAGADNFNDVVRFEARKWGKTEKKYPTLFVKVGGITPKWKYQLSEIPKVIETTNAKGVTVDWDDSDTNAFFKNVIDIDIMPKLEKHETHEPSKQETQSYNNAPMVEPLPEDNLPF